MHLAIKNLERKRACKKVRPNKEYIGKRINLIKENRVILRKELLNYEKNSAIKLITSNIKSNTIYYNPEIVEYLDVKLCNYYDKKFLRKHLVKIIFFISCLHFFRVIKKKNWDDYIQISYKFMRKVIGQRHLPKVLEIVLKSGVIECDNYYKYNGPLWGEPEREYEPGKCYGYRLNKRFWGCKFKSMPTHLKIGRGIQCFSTENQKYLIDCLNRASLPKDIAYEMVTKSNKKERAKESQCLFIDQFNEKNFYQTISKKTGRVFNSLSGFMRDVRQLILFDGKSTVEIDIAASQPLLLNTLYKTYDEKERIESCRFKDLTENGDFYEVVRKGGGLENIEKKQLKEELYRILFGPMRYNIEWKIRDWFVWEFPCLWARIQKLKEKHHSEVPIYLQKKESEIVIGAILTQFRLLNKPMLTVHDSFIVLEEDVEFTQKTIIEEFKKMYNLAPKLKIVQKIIINEPIVVEEETNEFGLTKKERLEIFKRYMDGEFIHADGVDELYDC